MQELPEFNLGGIPLLEVDIFNELDPFLTMSEEGLAVLRAGIAG